YANHADHHPPLVVTYGSCVVHWATHDPAGITELDVASAAAVEALAAQA
ncbi:MAG: 4a-hydroxytetrahydrobiopterin dehydratase, partial [Burkholderiaceae bacterium]